MVHGHQKCKNKQSDRYNVDQNGQLIQDIQTLTETEKQLLSGQDFCSASTYFFVAFYVFYYSILYMLGFDHKDLRLKCWVTCTRALLIMSIACDIQMATWWPFFWSVIRLVIVDFYLDWSKAGFITSHANTLWKAAPLNQNQENLHYNLLDLITHILLRSCVFSVCKEISEMSFYFLQFCSLFSSPYLRTLWQWSAEGLVEVTTSVTLCCDMDSGCGNGLVCPSLAGPVIRVTALWLRSKVLLSHWSIVIR